MKTMTFKIENSEKKIQLFFYREETSYNFKTDKADFFWFCDYKISKGYTALESGRVVGLQNNEPCGLCANTLENAIREVYR